MNAAILGIGTALPSHRLSREQAVRWGARCLAEHPTAVRLATRLLARSGIGCRWTCVADFAEGDGATMLGARSPTTDVRMRAFREHAPPLAEAACRRALQSAGVEPREISHLVLVTCTG